MEHGAAPGRPAAAGDWHWLGYACGVAAVGLLLGTAEWQHYTARGGRHPWEPYLWELSSVIVTGTLAPLVYRWHVAGLGHGLAWRHALGAVVFTLLHVGGMFALRFAVYVMAGVPYNPGSPREVLAYETGKDLVSYALITAICHGIHVFVDSQRLRSEQAEARLARLSEQLQPHFLFNCLNLISSVMYEDVARADRLLCDLSTLLRQTLAAQQAHEHTLDQELELIQPYLALMQARFGPRLQVAIDAGETARRCSVPTLQLISPVENAIKHNVASTEAGVHVSLRAWLDAAVLHLVVDNSGSAPLAAERGGAIGMDNLRQRLRVLYGDRATVTLRPREEGGSRLHIRLPAAAGAGP